MATGTKTDAEPVVRDFRLAEWLVEPGLNRVSRAGETHHLEPKVMDVLVFLASQEGRVVAQREIVSAIWAKRFMARTVVPRAVAELRRALGDDARTPRLIQTVSKRGYRVLVPALPADQGPRERERDGRRRRRATAGRGPLIQVGVPGPSGWRYDRWLLLAAALVISVAVLLGAVVGALADRFSTDVARRVAPVPGVTATPARSGPSAATHT